MWYTQVGERLGTKSEAVPFKCIKFGSSTCQGLVIVICSHRGWGWQLGGGCKDLESWTPKHMPWEGENVFGIRSGQEGKI